MIKQSLGLMGVGAFGRLALRHLGPHFDVVVCDPAVDTPVVVQEYQARVGDLATAAACDLVMLAVPVQKLRDVLQDIAPRVKAGALVIDVCSVKIKPLQAMMEILPPSVAVVGTHPLFGPQSGKNGIAGLNIAICEGRGGRSGEVMNFCRDILRLNVSLVTPEEHDREAAYVQGLTHMLAKIIVSLDLPAMRFPTRTYELMQQMVDMVRYDSDELFRAIARENPFAEQAKQDFFAAARRLEEKISQN